MPLAEVFEGGGALTVTLTSEAAAEAAAAEPERVVERGGDGGGRGVALGVAAAILLGREGQRLHVLLDGRGGADKARSEKGER